MLWYQSVPYRLSLHSTWHKLPPYAMEQLIPFTTSGSLVDIVDSESSNLGQSNCDQAKELNELVSSFPFITNDYPSTVSGIDLGC